MARRPAVATCRHLQTGLLAHLHFVFEKQRSLVCASGVRCRFCMPLCYPPTPSPTIEEKGQSLCISHHTPMTDPTVLPLSSCNQLMVTNLWGLENAAKAVISGEGPQQYASCQVRMLGTDLVAQRDNMRLGFLGRERGDSRACV